jgi:hypothetical protein
MEVSAQKVWQDCCNYLYLPRLLNEGVFVNAITQAVSTEDYFGYAAGREDAKYLGFTFGAYALVYLNGGSLLLSHGCAVDYKKKVEAEKCSVPVPSPGIPFRGSLPVPPAGTQPSASLPAPCKKTFYGVVSLCPVKAKLEFATLMDEVIQSFTSRPDVEVNISIEIQATGNKGFDEALQRAIKENCNVLKFTTAEFDE